jgi:hypothetical protein
MILVSSHKRLNPKQKTYTTSEGFNALLIILTMAEYVSTNHPTERGRTGKRKSILLHRLVWIEAHGEIPEGYVIHHKNGKKYDNRLENLECVSRKEHAIIHGAIIKKERNKEKLFG